MERNELQTSIEGILFAAGEPVSVERLSTVLVSEYDDIISAAAELADSYSFERRGIRIVRMDNMLQMCSAPELADTIRTALETRKPPKLSPTSLEVLAVVAYYQPVTRAYIEQVRGVDSAYTVGVLQERGLIEPAGRLEAPGRPVLYKTTADFLRTFGISSLDELPELPEAETENEGQLEIKNAIAALQEQNAAQEDTGAEG